MDELTPKRLQDDGLSPYRIFSRAEWAKLRADTPMTLTAHEVVRLQSLNDPISLEEVAAIYLPLSRLLSLYVAATQGLFRATQRFLLAEQRRQGAVHHRHRGLGGGGQVDHGARAARRCSRAGRTRRRSTSSPPTASCGPTPSSSAWA